MMIRKGISCGLTCLLLLAMYTGCQSRAEIEATANEAHAKLLPASPHSSPEQRQAIDTLAGIAGDSASGAAVFKRDCIACHTVDTTGARFGPSLSDVGTRMSRHEILESIVDPSAKVDPVYQTVNVLLIDGRVLTGLLLEEDDDRVSIHLPENKVVSLSKADDIDTMLRVKLSSMPENLLETMNAMELVDLVEYLSAQKTRR